MSPLKGQADRLIIGVGNLLRGDDAFGVEMVEKLENEHPALATYLTEQGDLTRIIPHWVGKDVIVIDAIHIADGEEGKIFLIHDFENLSSVMTNQYSSHSLNLYNVYQLSTQLEQRPKSLFFIGVQGKEWRIGKGLSAAVARAIPEVKGEILRYWGKR